LVCVAGFITPPESTDRDRPDHLLGELNADVKPTTAQEKRTASAALRAM
jgi:hypothetical protein